MTTKAPAKVQEFSTESLEKIAYGSVDTIPTVEPNDRNRLGYHVFRMLSLKEGNLKQIIEESGARIQISTTEATKIIADSLSKHGITVH